MIIKNYKVYEVFIFLIFINYNYSNVYWIYFFKEKSGSVMYVIIFFWNFCG